MTQFIGQIILGVTLMLSGFCNYMAISNLQEQLTLQRQTIESLISTQKSNQDALVATNEACLKTGIVVHGVLTREHEMLKREQQLLFAVKHSLSVLNNTVGSTVLADWPPRTARIDASVITTSEIKP